LKVLHRSMVDPQSRCSVTAKRCEYFSFRREAGSPDNLSREKRKGPLLTTALLNRQAQVAII
jgi:hypothetical protein